MTPLYCDCCWEFMYSTSSPLTAPQPNLCAFCAEERKHFGYSSIEENSNRAIAQRLFDYRAAAIELQ